MNRDCMRTKRAEIVTMKRSEPNSGTMYVKWTRKEKEVPSVYMIDRPTWRLGFSRGQLLQKYLWKQFGRTSILLILAKTVLFKDGST
jgi:hypothetical protein